MIFCLLFMPKMSLFDIDAYRGMSYHDYWGLRLRIGMSIKIKKSSIHMMMKQHHFIDLGHAYPIKTCYDVKSFGKKHFIYNIIC